MPEIPDLDVFDLGNLRESIRKHGVREPVVVDEEQRILDGHTRVKIANELGIACPYRVVTGLTDAEKDDLAFMLNAARRHLSVEKKRELWKERRQRIEAVLTETPERSDRSIAEEVGADHKTVSAAREDLEVNGEIPKLERRGRAEPKEVAENFADHRNELYFEFMLHYPCPSDEIRMRGNDPYPKASTRTDWPSGSLYLTCEAPRNEAQAGAMLSEAFQLVSREMAKRPLRTMARQLA